MNNGYFIDSLDNSCKAILKEEYPVFSEQEYLRRISLIEDIIKKNNLDKVIIYEALGSGNAVQYFTGWHTTQEALVEIKENEDIKLHVEHYNHLPMAKKLINSKTKLLWGERQLANKISVSYTHLTLPPKRIV